MSVCVLLGAREPSGYPHPHSTIAGAISYFIPVQRIINFHWIFLSTGLHISIQICSYRVKTLPAPCPRRFLFRSQTLRLVRSQTLTKVWEREHKSCIGSSCFLVILFLGMCTLRLIFVVSGSPKTVDQVYALAQPPPSISCACEMTCLLSHTVLVVWERDQSNFALR